MNYLHANENSSSNAQDHKTNTGYNAHSTVTTPLINRSQSDPSATSIKHNTLFVPSKIRDSSRDDSYSGSIRRYSVERIPIKSSQWRQETEEEIIVPARDHLVKMPFFSTPLTLESTNNAFYDFRERLIEMGFESQAEAALVHTQCESVENAVTFILNNFDAIYHRFEDRYDAHASLRIVNEFTQENIDTNKLCAVCSQPFYQHLLDHNGNKVQIDANEANYNNNDDFFFDEKEEETVNVATEYRSISIQNTESLLPPSIMYSGNVQTELCLICFQDKPLDNYPASECGHNRYCKQCLTEHYKIKTKNGDVLKVKCIDPRCEREIKESEILNFLTDHELKEKFQKFKRQKLLMLNENARFCITTDCDGYMIGSRLRPKLKCPECATKICFNCSKLWHGYFTKCSSAQISQEHVNDAKFYQWELNKKENVKKCPKCKIRIEKDAGCNHMTCTSCKYQFCWLCKGKYSGVHYKSWNIFGCPGAQFSGSSMISIHSCPQCCPIWLRRLLFFIAFLIFLPLIIACGVLMCVIYITGFCIYGLCRCMRCDC